MAKTTTTISHSEEYRRGVADGYREGACQERRRILEYLTRQLYGSKDANAFFARACKRVDAGHHLPQPRDDEDVPFHQGEGNDR